jgi:hypothetical protein
MIERNRSGIDRRMPDRLANPATLQWKSDGSRIAVGFANPSCCCPSWFAVARSGGVRRGRCHDVSDKDWRDIAIRRNALVFGLHSMLNF